MTICLGNCVTREFEKTAPLFECVVSLPATVTLVELKVKVSGVAMRLTGNHHVAAAMQAAMQATYMQGM